MTVFVVAVVHKFQILDREPRDRPNPDAFLRRGTDARAFVEEHRQVAAGEVVLGVHGQALAERGFSLAPAFLTHAAKTEVELQRDETGKGVQ